jgi:hypothetical protein
MSHKTRKTTLLFLLTASFLWTAYYLSPFQLNFSLPDIFAASVSITQNGNPSSTIVVPDDWDESDDVFAANELQEYVRKVSGAKIPILKETAAEGIAGVKIYVGNCRASSAIPATAEYQSIINDGYLIDIKEDAIRLFGKITEKGNNKLTTQFAVYGFLEKYLGYRWFLPEVFTKDENGNNFPDNMGTYVPPNKKNITLPVETWKQDPSFKYRLVLMGETDWRMQNGINMGSSKDYEPDSDPDLKNMFRISQVAGHAFLRFVPPSEFCKSHELDGDYVPKAADNYYYAQINGKNKSCKEIYAASFALGNSRMTLGTACKKYFEDGNDYTPNLDDGTASKYTCQKLVGIFDQESIMKINDSNPEVRNEIAKNLADYIAANPQIELFNIGPADGVGFDASAASKAMDGENRAGYTVDDLNKYLSSDYLEGLSSLESNRVLAKRITVVYRDIIEKTLGIIKQKLSDEEYKKKKIVTSAYHSYLYPPQEDLGFQFNDSAMLAISHSYESNHPIEDRSSEVNLKFDDALKGWKKYYSNLGIYEYYNKMLMADLPFPIAHSIKKDIPYYHKNGVRSFITQGGTGLAGSLGLNYYLTSKLLWNVDADVDGENGIMLDFYDKFYGPASVDMKSFYDRMEKAAVDSGLELAPPNRELIKLFPDDALEDCSRFIASAKNSISGSSESESKKKLHLARISLSEKSLEYTQSVTDYLKEVRTAFESQIIPCAVRICTDRGEISTSEMDRLRSIAEEIRTKRNNIYIQYKIVQGEDAYVRNLLDPQYIIDDFFDGFAGKRSNYTKKSYFWKNDLWKASKYENIGRKVDIWTYAKDIDYEGEPEHQLLMRNKKGEFVGVGKIAQSTEIAGHNQDKAFIIKNIELSNYVQEDKYVNLQIVNLGGDSSVSTFYDIALMPHQDVSPSQAEMKDYFENDIQYVRQKSFGFVETKKTNSTSAPLEFTIDLFSNEIIVDTTPPSAPAGLQAF